jgi:hypothetical protein
VSRTSARVVWYRFRATLQRRWGGYLAIVLLIGLVGGIALGSIAAARRTQSSFSTFLASTNPSDLDVSPFVFSDDPNANSYSANFTDSLAHLPNVKQVRTWIGLNTAPLHSDGTPDLSGGNQVIPVGSVDGLYFTQDRATAVEGRMADPTRADEFVMTAAAAQLTGFHVGEEAPFGFYSNDVWGQLTSGASSVQPQFKVNMKLVGIVVLNNSVVQDDVDRFPTLVLFTPSLTEQVLTMAGSAGCCSYGSYYGLQLAQGADTAAVERGFTDLLPAGAVANFHVTSRVVGRVDRAVKPEAIALGVFGAIAALAVFFIAIQAISRQLRSSAEDLDVLRALGAGPAATAGDGLIGILGAVVLGALLSVVVAVGLSPLSPLGPVRPVFPTSGIVFDWTVLGIGLLVLIGGLGTTAVALAYKGAPHRVALKSQLVTTRPSSVARTAASAGLSAPGVVGVRLALESGRGRTAAPVRSALLGSVLAMVTLVATVTFGSSLQTLVSHPALYGWNWTYLLNTPDGIVPPHARALLDQDPDVAAWTGIGDIAFDIDGHDVPSLETDVNAAVSPPILSGHGLAADNQIVLGSDTITQLHKHLGDTVVVTVGSPASAPFYIPPTSLVIVGTTTLPSIGYPDFVSEHASMGTGAVVSRGIEPAELKQAQTNPDPELNGPKRILVRLKDSITPDAGRADMQRIADAANVELKADPNGPGVDGVFVLSVQRPAEIVNYRSMGATPALLAGGLALGAITALGLTLATSVRRRRRDLALLKTLGFTRRQLAATVAWQATVAAFVGIVVGVPLGIALGRWLWILFAGQIAAVPHPTVPVTSLILVAVGALVLANLVAALPGRSAARTPTAQVLRSD